MDKIIEKIFKNNIELNKFLHYHPSAKYKVEKLNDNRIKVIFEMKKIQLSKIDVLWSYDHEEKDYKISIGLAIQSIKKREQEKLNNTRLIKKGR